MNKIKCNFDNVVIDLINNYLSSAPSKQTKTHSSLLVFNNKDRNPQYFHIYQTAFVVVQEVIFCSFINTSPSTLALHQIDSSKLILFPLSIPQSF